MPAPKGHKMWGDPLNPKKFESPQELWEKAMEYFKWCDDNPWVKTETTRGDKGFSEKETPAARPYLKQGLCVYLNVSLQTLSNYRNKEGYETYFGVAKQIEFIIEQNQLEGASVGAYNPSIISRLLGLVDKQDHTTDGEKIVQKNTIIFGGKEVEI